MGKIKIANAGVTGIVGTALAKCFTCAQFQHRNAPPGVVLLEPDGGIFWNPITVPVDEELNRLARRMIERPSSVVPLKRKPDETATYQIRISGVDALQRFETNSNESCFSIGVQDLR